MKQEHIDRISELSRLARARELTQEEEEERAQLRQEYIADMRGSLSAHLDNIVVETPDGQRRPLKPSEDEGSS